MKVLYVEDNPQDLDLTRRTFEREGKEYLLDSASSLNEARAKLDGQPGYDLVLLDLRLPDGSGLDLLAEIRERGLPLAVVILTGTGDEATAVNALKAGADDYIVKRVDYPTKLPQTLGAALRRFHAESVRRSSPLRILYAEHHRADADLTLRHMARHAPHIKLEVVAEAGAILDRLAGWGKPPSAWDVLLVDYRLPGMNGLELLKILREDRGLDLPVVLVTGQGSEDGAVQALRLGATDYLVKTPGYLSGLPAVLENAHHRVQVVRNQSELRERTRELEQFFEYTLDLLSITDAEGRFRRLSREWENVLGYSREELLGNTILELVHPDDVQASTAELTRLTNKEEVKNFVNRLRCRNGEYRWIEWRSHPQDDLIFSAARDITGRMLAEEKLRQFQFCIAHAAIGIFRIEEDGSILYANEQACRSLGYAPEELSAMKVFDINPRLTPEKWQEHRSKARARGSRTLETIHRRKDGSEFPVEVTISYLKYGGRMFSFSFVQDISARVEAQNFRERQLGRNRLLNEIARNLLARHDLHSIYTVVLQHLEKHFPANHCCIWEYSNSSGLATPAACGAKGEALLKLLGISLQSEHALEFLGLSDCLEGKAVYLHDIREEGLEIFRKLSGQGFRTFMGLPLHVGTTLFGVLLVQNASAAGLTDEERAFFTTVAEHVSLAVYQARLHEDLEEAYEELQQAQSAMLQQERLRALGQMASGIAHDINNALSPVVGYAQLLQMDETLSNKSRRYVEAVLTAGKDIAHIVSRMREFYRQRDDKDILLPIKINGLVKQVVELNRPRWKDMPQEAGVTIDVTLDLAEDLPEVWGNESELREALTNLIGNAVDAMPEGGSLMLRTFLSPQGFGLGQQARAGRGTVVIVVQDSGTGMDEETRKRALEPFFSTKGEEGTGLGLAMVYGVMQRHDGEIEIRSRKGEGTTVLLAFPVREETPGNGVVIPSPPERKGQRPLHLLYIDDENKLRRVVQEMLEAEGHTVTLAAGGREGIEVFLTMLEQDRKIDVVITDLGMPEVDGRKVARAVKRLSPDTPVILLTGWGNRRGMSEERPDEADLVLGKPPQLSMLKEGLARLTGNQT